MSHSDYEMWKLARRMNQVMDEWMHAKFSADPDETWAPPVDVVECGDHICVLAELAGMIREDIDVSAEPKRLTLSGRRELASDHRPTAVHQLEVARGTFRRIIELPCPIETSGVKATYSDGMLHVILPKAK